MIINQIHKIGDLSEKRIALIIRHAERETINNNEFGNDVSITNNGKKEAELLGCTLASCNVNRIYTSPIRRCVQTALSIQKGMGRDVDIVLTNQLGDPGFHIQEAKIAGETYIRDGIEKIYHDFLTGNTPNGWASAESLRTTALGYIKSKTAEKGLTLFITHDCLIAHFAFANGIKTYNYDNDWCGFLDGVVVDCSYKSMLKFHEPGIAPVEDETGWYHIDSTNTAIYPQRYKRTFGYYCGLAAVTDFHSNCFHINTCGKRIYKDNYAFCGNYQEDKCVVRDFENHYFHIDNQGRRLYPDNYLYVGDYKDGIACVKQHNGRFRHIDAQGRFLNNKEFVDLGVFHKNFAIAKDANGWFHIDTNGNELYLERYLMIEPFYNGFALVTRFDGSKQIINENGELVLCIG